MEARGEAVFGLEREALLRLDASLALEWLETDGRGGYASSTVLGCNRRRYHGLLVSPLPGSTKRYVFLSRLEDALWAPKPLDGAPDGGQAFALSSAAWGAEIAPKGHVNLERFELVPWPRWTFRIGPARLERELLLVKGSPTVLVRWRLSGDVPPLELSLRPLLACREADALQVANDVLERATARLEGHRCAREARPYRSLPALDFALDGGAPRWIEGALWYRDTTYAIDAARGYEDREDLFTPGTLKCELEPGRWTTFAASIESLPRDPAALFEAQADVRRAALERAGPGRAGRLALGADDFLVRAPTRIVPGPVRERAGVVAGWPWFLEWGRDSAIALPGLLLARGRVEACGEALGEFAGYLSRGLLPNVFGLAREDSHYGSADASLWYARAVLCFDRAGGDATRLRELLVPALTEIAERYLEGTALGVGADSEGLIAAGSGELNATWMDARTASGPVTPRHGCAVEINALWYQLLAHLTELCERFDERARARAWRALAERTGRSFLARLWLAEERRLADRWNDGAPDRSVRPNMVLAAAAELSPLSRDQRAAVVECAERELLTPRGLRTLSPQDPSYRGRYAGDVAARDAAYHQGTVWPWLLGFHVEASLRAFPRDAARRARLGVLLDGLLEELDRAGLGHVSEVFDGDAPHEPGGTIAQAWNTAELLRARRMLAEGRA
jgi:predicted glycogen debranching enzyme